MDENAMETLLVALETTISGKMDGGAQRMKWQAIKEQEMRNG